MQFLWDYAINELATVEFHPKRCLMIQKAWLTTERAGGTSCDPLDEATVMELMFAWCHMTVGYERVETNRTDVHYFTIRLCGRE